MAPVNLSPDRFHPVHGPQSCRGTDDHSTPEDVLRDRSLSLAEKRALLASWLSDIRAVEHMPSYRQLDNGALVRLDDIYDALRKLDEQPTRWRLTNVPANQRWHRTGVFRRDDDDDDPPPAPAGLGTLAGAPLWQAA